jgi:N-acetylglutamate synthase/N-acetylornithine aminotransferase
MKIKVNIHDLKKPSDYIQKGRTHIFPNMSTLLSFIKFNKQYLIEQKAILKINGRLLIHTSLFDRAIFLIGYAKCWT